jgi:putative oxidoreductase
MTGILSDKVSPQSIDAGTLVLRVTVAIILLFHGVFKLTHGVAWIAGPLGAIGLPSFLAYGVYAAEVVAPILLIVGYQVRLAALVIAFDMLMAIALVLRDQVFAVKSGGGGWGVEVEAFILLGAVAIFFLGSGKYRIGQSRSA